MWKSTSQCDGKTDRDGDGTLAKKEEKYYAFAEHKSMEKEKSLLYLLFQCEYYNYSHYYYSSFLFYFILLLLLFRSQESQKENH